MSIFIAHFSLHLVLALSSLPTSSSAPALAPQTEPSTEPAATDSVFDILEEERETATKIGVVEYKIREAPSSIWVIDQATIRAAAATSLHDLLRLIPGIFPRERGSGQTEASTRFPGSFPENQTLVMIDGRSVLYDFVGIFDRHLVDVHDVERIEVIFGPSSTIFGANAFSGVINIVTRRAKTNGHRAWLNAGGGVAIGAVGDTPALDRVGPMGQAFAEYSYGWERGGFRLSVGAVQLPGFGMQTDLGQLIVEPSRRLSAQADVHHTTERGFELRAQLQAYLKRSALFLLSGTTPTQQDYSTNFVLSKRALAGADDELLINVWARVFNFDYAVDLPGLASIRTNTRQYSGELRLQYMLPTFWRNRLIIGTQLRGVLSESDMIAPEGRQQLMVGLYVEDHLRIIEPLVLVVGLRADTREGPGIRPFRYFSASPRAALTWLVNASHSLRAEYASAFRTPTTIERAAVLENADGVPFLRGIADLENERVHAWSLAWLGRFGWLEPRIEVYVARTLGNIRPVQVPVTAPETSYRGFDFHPDASYAGYYKLPLFFENVPGFWIPGAVVRFDAKPIPRLALFAQYSFSPTGLMHLAGAGATWSGERFSVSGQLYYQDKTLGRLGDGREYQNAARFIANLRASYWLDTARRWRIGLNALNFADIRFVYGVKPGMITYWRDPSNGERVGPRIWLDLEFRFDGGA